MIQSNCHEEPQNVVGFLSLNKHPVETETSNSNSKCIAISHWSTILKRRLLIPHQNLLIKATVFDMQFRKHSKKCLIWLVAFLKTIILGFFKGTFSMELKLYKGHIKSFHFNPLSNNHTKWSNTLKQFVGKLLTNCLSVFDHFGAETVKGHPIINLLIIAFKCEAYCFPFS